MPNFIEISCTITKLRAKRYQLMIIHVTSSQCKFPDNKIHGANIRPTWVLSAPGGSHVSPMNLAIRVGMSNKQIAAIRISWLGGNITPAQFHHIIQRLVLSVAAYIAVRRDLTRVLHCYKLPCYVPAKLAYRAGWILNVQCRPHWTSSMYCSKSILLNYIKFSKHQHKNFVDALTKYHRNRANLAYSFLC